MRKTIILFLLIIFIPSVFSLSLEYKTITSNSYNNNIEISFERSYLTSFDFLMINSSETKVRIVNHRFFLNFLENNNTKQSHFTNLRTILKQYHINNTYRNNIYYSSDTIFGFDHTIRLIKRVELKRLYQEFINEFELEKVTVLFGRTRYDEELFNESLSGFKNGIVYYNNKPLNYPHEAILFSKKINRKRTIIIQGMGAEGEIAALRKLLLSKEYYSKHSTVEYINGLDNVETYDFIHQNNSWFNYNVDDYKEKLRKALFGKFDQINYTVITPNNISLRFRHVKSLVSSKIKDYNNISDTPIVFAGGLWSDIDAWKELSSELSDKGYNTWMIEITGGPGQDCNTCINYNYTDLITEYWPALIGAIQTLNNNSKIYYVGHSNGARTAISSLEIYNNKGKNNTGTITLNNKNNNETNNTTTINVSMTKNPTTRMVAVGVPGSFEGQGMIHAIIKLRSDNLNENINKTNTSHYSFLQLGVNALFPKKINSTNQKISLNLWNNYFYWINSSEDKQIGINLSLNNFLIIKGTGCITSDCIVTTKDEDQIFNNINSTNKKLESVFTIHLGMGENPKIKRFIMKFIK